MKGIKMKDCRFYVNEDERTVVCVVPKTQDMVLDFIRENFEYHDIDLYEAINFWDGNFYTKTLQMPRNFIGKAVCSKDDVWDEELGRMIAFSKAKEKCYKSFFKRANMFVQTLDRRLGDAITKFNDFGIRLENNRLDLNQKIEERLNPTVNE